ncbi:MAG: PKD domain-containing protein [Deltaproteobacteria bacterium]|nr:PKD domain-containing protein [Deltaproteobacteria bacterium]
MKHGSDSRLAFLVRASSVLFAIPLFACSNGSNKLPTADFVYSPAEPEPGEKVFFDASASIDRDGAIVEYAFDFGDSSPARWYKTSGPKMEHIFSKQGIYWVKLEIRDNNGGISQAAKPVEVKKRPEEYGMEIDRAGNELERLDEPFEPDAGETGDEEDASLDLFVDENDVPSDVSNEQDAQEEKSEQEEQEQQEKTKFSGYVALVEFKGETRTSVSAFAGFSRPKVQDCGYQHQVTDIGDCRVTIARPDDPGKDCLPSETLSGGLITISGGIIDPIVLAPQEGDNGGISYKSNIAKDAQRIFDYSSMLTIEIEGNKDETVPPMSGILTTPADFQITEPDLTDRDLYFTPGDAVAIRWSGAIDDQVERMTIVITTANEETGVSYDCICTPMDTGSFKVSGEATGLIPDGSQSLSIMLTRGEHQRLYSGEEGYFMATSTIYRGGSASIRK